jgi:hypothetical protein
MNLTESGEQFDIALKRTSKRIDQAITSHCILRDRYEKWSTAISVAVILASAALTFLALANDDVRSMLLPRGMLTDNVLAFCGFIVLMLSILDLRFNWKEKAAKHGEAANALSRLKLVINRDAADVNELSRERFEKLQTQYEDLSDLIAKIPESKFLKLKAVHRRKVELSKMLDTHPGASVTLLRVKLWIRDNANRQS